MIETIWQVAKQTPWWVYVLFFALLNIGIKASKTGVVSLIKLSIAPIIFTIMAIETLLNNLALDSFVVSIFAATLLLGVVLGWLQVAFQTLRFDKRQHLIEVPGTWTVMWVILIIFSTKYYFGYALSEDPNIIQNTYFEVAFIGVTAVCTGLFIGKLLCYIKRMLTEPQSDLSDLS